MSRPRRREARIARKIEKELAQKKKQARFVEAVAPQPAGKKPRAKENPNSIFSMTVAWDCDDPDVAGVWSWGVERQWSTETWDSTILPKLQEFERLTWGEVDQASSGSSHKMHHNMDCGDLCYEAVNRLFEIEKIEDTIFRFRLGGRERLWGFRYLNKFSILWFDPTHQIYPVD